MPISLIQHVDIHNLQYCLIISSAAALLAILNFEMLLPISLDSLQSSHRRGVEVFNGLAIWAHSLRVGIHRCSGVSAFVTDTRSALGHGLGESSTFRKEGILQGP